MYQQVGVGDDGTCAAQDCSAEVHECSMYQLLSFGGVEEKRAREWHCEGVFPCAFDSEWAALRKKYGRVGSGKSRNGAFLALVRTFNAAESARRNDKKPRLTDQEFLRLASKFLASALPGSRTK
jgi:hypothetical protein